MCRRSLLVVTLVGFLALSGHAQEDDDEPPEPLPDEMQDARDLPDSPGDVNDLQRAFKNVNLEDVLTRFGKLLSEYHWSDGLFREFNHWTDKDAAGEQNLGFQEVRSLLQDIGLGNLLLRGELATALIQACDRTGDKRINTVEFAAVVNVGSCWLQNATDGDVLGPGRQLAAAMEAAPGPYAAASLLGDSVRACEAETRAISELWTLWAPWLKSLEASVMPPATLASAEACTDAAADALLGPEPGKPVMVDGALVAPKRGGKKRPQKVGRASVRNELRKRGVRAFLVRVVAADAIVKLGDTSGDKQLDRDELKAAAARPCAVAAAAAERGVTLADVGRFAALGGYTPAQFRADLDADASDALAAARAAAAATEPPTPDEVAALAEAYVRLAPLKATKDEL